MKRFVLALGTLLLAASAGAADETTTTTTPVQDDKLRFFHRVDYNFLFGIGLVGAAQYDQGDPKLMATVNMTPYWPSKSLSLGGLGLSVRATLPPDAWFFESDNFNEFGLGVPVATYRSGRFAMQTGVEIQRINFQKNFYYVAFGLRWAPRKPAQADSLRR